MYIQVKNPSSTLNHKIIEVVPAPIDEKNILSDWINEELLEDCAQRGNEYLGWLGDNAPVHGKIHKNGQLELRIYGSSTMSMLKNKLTEIFANSINEGSICNSSRSKTLCGYRVI